ncbi:hypothetical protein BKA69DRAFT_1102240 [Paraphysoderma sedebokerense]|nr:hypothetical protein BKA69DRAFT_1102240 [Paraphysoderma sedebokerense]
MKLLYSVSILFSVIALICCQQCPSQVSGNTSPDRRISVNTLKILYREIPLEFNVTKDLQSFVDIIIFQKPDIAFTCGTVLNEPCEVISNISRLLHPNDQNYTIHSLASQSPPGEVEGEVCLMLTKVDAAEIVSTLSDVPIPSSAQICRGSSGQQTNGSAQLKLPIRYLHFLVSKMPMSILLIPPLRKSNQTTEECIFEQTVASKMQSLVSTSSEWKRGKILSEILVWGADLKSNETIGIIQSGTSPALVNLYKNYSCIAPNSPNFRPSTLHLLSPNLYEGSETLTSSFLCDTTTNPATPSPLPHPTYFTLTINLLSALKLRATQELLQDSPTGNNPPPMVNGDQMLTYIVSGVLLALIFLVIVGFTLYKKGYWKPPALMFPLSLVESVINGTANSISNTLSRRERFSQFENEDTGNPKQEMEQITVINGSFNHSSTNSNRVGGSSAGVGGNSSTQGGYYHQQSNHTKSERIGETVLDASMNMVNGVSYVIDKTVTMGRNVGDRVAAATMGSRKSSIAGNRNRHKHKNSDATPINLTESEMKDLEGIRVEKSDGADVSLTGSGGSHKEGRRSRDSRQSGGQDQE